MAPGRYEGKVALVTGGTSGIGLAIAIGFAQEGARVSIVGRSAEKGEAALGRFGDLVGNVCLIRADVADAADCSRIVDETLSRFGRLDCAVNNAVNSHYSEEHLATHEGSVAAFDGYMALLLRSVWVGMKFQLQHMVKQGHGCIVNTSSVDALRCHSGGAGQAIYCAGKCAVIGLTRAVAKEYATQGIRINSLCPGGFDTPLMDELFLGKAPDEVEQLKAELDGLIPMRRLGVPHEAAEAVLWMCSDAASYVTGHNMVVSGGMD